MRIFHPREFVGRNVNGSNDGSKMALDPEKLLFIQKQVQSFYEVSDSNFKDVWKKCVDAMNERLRRPLQRNVVKKDK